MGEVHIFQEKASFQWKVHFPEICLGAQAQLKRFLVKMRPGGPTGKFAVIWLRADKIMGVGGLKKKYQPGLRLLSRSNAAAAPWAQGQRPDVPLRSISHDADGRPAPGCLCHCHCHAPRPPEPHRGAGAPPLVIGIYGPLCQGAEGRLGVPVFHCHMITYGKVGVCHYVGISRKSLKFFIL